MSDYRLYCLDGSGNIGFADWIRAADDRDAVAQARLLKRAARKCEVWQGNRLVATLDTSDLMIHSAHEEQTLYPPTAEAAATYPQR